MSVTIYIYIGCIGNRWVKLSLLMGHTIVFDKSTHLTIFCSGFAVALDNLKNGATQNISSKSCF